MTPFQAELIVEKYLNGVRIDSFLLKHFRNYTPFRIQRIVRGGGVRIEGVTVELDCRVYVGQHVSVRLFEPPDKLLRPEAMPLDILFEDPWLLVINKPPGQIVHPVGMYQTGSLCNAVQGHLDQQTVLRGLLRPGIVHRLDRQTSGVIVVAKEHLSHRLLSIQFQREQISKQYLALVEGEMPQNEGTIDLPIGRIPGHRSALMTAKRNAVEPRTACTRFAVVARFPNFTLVRVHPQTGRNHQIRVHLAEIGYPIVGDEIYDAFGAIKDLPADLEFEEELDEQGEADFGVAQNAPQYASLSSVVPHAKERASRASARPSDILGRQLQGHALHASRIEFTHPITLDSLAFDASLPQDFQNILLSLRAAQRV